MRTDTSGHLGAGRNQSPAETEFQLLELFAPVNATASATPFLSRQEYAPLWRADAIHRAKNMAQMTLSLANVAEHPSRHWLPSEIAKQVRQLSRVYAALGTDEESPGDVPCAAFLHEIATRLGTIFGRSRQIAVTVQAAEVYLPQDMRRALLLVGSELIINALKYGFPVSTGGTICVVLAIEHGRIELIVEDNGIGIVETCTPGQGSGILQSLVTALGAITTRGSGALGGGFRVVTVVPIPTPPDTTGAG